MDRTRIREIFADAAELTSSERAAFLDRACGNDAELRREVESLLRAMEGAGDYFKGLQRSVDDATSAHEDLSGTSVGGFKLLERIGEGGFGVVYMAEQERPLRRRVAIKILKAGMDSRAILARFEAERQALAAMDHPNIARIFDAGMTEHGRPYFAMELLRGTSITEYCDENRLTPRERVALMLPVCDAVHHAHMKGIIHRDLKPSNVIITHQDGVPAPKVIDFGVAKAIGDPLTDATLFTQFRHIIGTPAYMSPEQAAMSGSDVDVRSDVYSLGALLYELLVGAPPFKSADLLSLGLAEMHRVIRERDPPTPSTRLRTTDLDLHAIAAQRGTEPARLSRMLRGELDWIVMRALEKDRRHRYDGASALAADLRRYLQGEAVLAGPPSVGYRVRRYIRRHRVALAVVGTFGLALVVGILSLLVALEAVRRQRDESEVLHRLAEAREAQSRKHALSAALNAAAAAIESGDGLQAIQMLRLVPEASRNWEWRFLHSQIDESIRTITLPSTADRLSPTADGAVFLAVPRDNNLWAVVDADTGRILRTFESREVSLSPDASTAIVLQKDGSFACFEIASGRERWRTEGSLSSASGVRGFESACVPPHYTISADRAVSPDRTRWVIWQPSPDGRNEVQVRSMQDGRLQRSFRVSAPIGSIPFFFLHPDGKLAIFIGSYAIDPESGENRPLPVGFHISFALWFDRTTRAGRWSSVITDWSLGRNVTIELRGPEWTSNVDVNRDFTLGVARDGTGTIRTWDLTSEDVSDARPHMLLPGAIASVRLSRDDRFVLALMDDRTAVSVIPLARSRAAEFRSDDSRVSAALSGDGRFSFSTGWGDVLAVDLGTLMPLWRRNLSWEWCTAIDATMSGDRVAVACGGRDRCELFLLDGRTGNTLWRFAPRRDSPEDARFSQLIRALAFTHDQSRLIVAMEGLDALVVDAQTGRALAHVPLPFPSHGLVPSPDGSQIALTTRFPSSQRATDAYGTGRLCLLDGTTAKQARAWDTPFPVCALAWSRDGRSVFITSGIHAARIEVDTGAVSWSRLLPAGVNVRVLAATPDGHRLLLCREDGRGIVLDARTGEHIVELALPIDLPIAAEFSAEDDALLVSACYSPGESIQPSPTPALRTQLQMTRDAWSMLSRLPPAHRFLPTQHAADFFDTCVGVDDATRSLATEIHLRLGFSARWANSFLHGVIRDAEKGKRSGLETGVLVGPRCIEQFPHEPSPRLNYARILQLLDRHEDALAALEACTPLLEPGDQADAHALLRGVCLARLGRRAEAAELTASVLERLSRQIRVNDEIRALRDDLEAALAATDPPS